MYTPHTNEIVDFRPELFAIKQQFGPRYYCEAEAIAAAANLWGAECNACGVLVQATEEIEITHSRYSARIRLFKTRKGYWPTALSYSTSFSGFGTPASVWRETAFRCDLSARRAAIGRVLKGFERAEPAQTSSADMIAFRRKLEAELTPQLALF